MTTINIHLTFDILTHKRLRIGLYKYGFGFEIKCALLKERLKSGQICTENQPLGTPEGLISRTRLKKLLNLKLWYSTEVHMTTLCTNLKQNGPTFISKSAPVSQAEALNLID